MKERNNGIKMTIWMKIRKEHKNLLKSLVLVMMFSLFTTTGGVLQQANTQEVNAAAISISASKVTLKIGDSKKLSIKNTKKKATWKTSNKKVATVGKKGLVKAMAKGTATITATVNGKKYTCKITVRELTAKETLTKASKAVKKAYGDDYLPNMELDSFYLEEVIGLKSNTYDAVVAEGPMISAQVDTFIGVHASSGKKSQVETALKAYQSYLINDALQYPMNQPKVEASKVVTIGDYVFFVMLGKPNGDFDANEAKLLAYYEDQNDIGILAIKKAMGY